MRRTLDTVGKRHWPTDRQGRPIYPDGFEDLARKLGRPLHPPGRDVRCIVSAGMLTEAWDCNMPAIIDTPMARLDAQHHNQLVERYFPHASHQLVVLSTDTAAPKGEWHQDKGLRPADRRPWYNVSHARRPARTRLAIRLRLLVRPVLSSDRIHHRLRVGHAGRSRRFRVRHRCLLRDDWGGIGLVVGLVAMVAFWK